MERSSLLLSSVWAGKEKTVKLDIRKLNSVECRLGLPDLQWHYMVGLLKYAALWCTEGGNGEKWLLAGLLEKEEEDLPKHLMIGSHEPEDCPYVVGQVARVWELALKQIMEKPPNARLFPLWCLKPF
ncbi:hypothetical protein NDU88_008821 [Pleurodeles waltl]|uniref:Uncharacterized protein n=1 Tax=Pleurodeles waltl TaxID=8319 RepID=A0AAV7QSU9_PLEWA|nr:hypothetical protein NDU88_008821 [Pleurodeles waltl]